MFDFGRRLLGRQPRRNIDASTVEKGGVPIRTTPALMLLVPDAAGLASYRAEIFVEVKDAEEFLEYWFPEPVRSGVIAFWALTWRPADEHDGRPTAEALVLIRDHGRQNVVYPFSFPRRDIAEEFIREALRAGIELACVSLYWARQVSIETTSFGNVRLSPSDTPLPDPGKQTESKTRVEDARRIVAAELKRALVSHRALTEAWTAAGDALFSALVARQALIKACRRGMEAITHAAWLHAARLDVRSERRDSGAGTRDVDPEALLAIAEALRIISEHHRDARDLEADDDGDPDDGPAYRTRDRDADWSPSIEEIIRELDRFRNKYRPDWPERPFDDPDENAEPDAETS